MLLFLYIIHKTKEYKVLGFHNGHWSVWNPLGFDTV